VSIHEIVLDDGGMNLLSSRMLRWIGEQVARLPGYPVAEAEGQPENLPTQPILILRSARPRLFAAGADMAEMRGFGPRQAEEFASVGQEVFEAIERLPFVTVAIIDGDCFGGALDLALAFDLRFVTPASRFSHPGAKLGIVTGFGGTSRWRKVLTPAGAKQLFLANRILTAEEALAIGLADRIGESFDDEIRRLAALDPPATRFLKELSTHEERLTASQRLMLAGRLARLYDS
jgi:enoyl-CoA hydratase/carnithine racemase